MAMYSLLMTVADLYVNVLLICPSMQLARFAAVAHCVLQLRVRLMMTPRSFSSVVVSSKLSPMK